MSERTFNTHYYENYAYLEPFLNPEGLIAYLDALARFVRVEYMKGNPKVSWQPEVYLSSLATISNEVQHLTSGENPPK